MLQCINVKLKLKFVIELQLLQAVYLRGTTYLWTPLFGIILVVTLFVKGAVAVYVLHCCLCSVCYVGVYQRR